MTVSTLLQHATLGKSDHSGTYASPALTRKSSRQQTAVYEPVPVFTSRTDTGCSTNSTTTVTNAAITAADSGRAVSGTNIPAGAIVTDVTPGVSHKINVAATGTASGLSLTYSALPDAKIAGAKFIVADQVLGYRLWGRSGSSTFFLQRSSDSGGSFVGPGAPSTSPEIISAVMPLPNGRALFATSDSVDINTLSTVVKLYMNDQALGSTFTQVASLDVGGYVEAFSFDCHDPAVLLVSVYGYKFHASTASPNRNARYLYRSTDGGFTWTQVLDIGGFHNQHCHTPYVAPDRSCWLTTGDGDAVGTDADADLDANRRAVWSSPAGSLGASGSWTPNVLLDPDDGVTRLQFVGVTYFTPPGDKTWLYLGEDNIARGRIVRCDPANPTGTVEVAYDPAVGQAPLSTTQVATWAAPFYALGVDPVYNVLYTYQRSETATDRGRVMCSADGINFVTLAEVGATGDDIGAGRFTFQNDSVYYGQFRFRRRTFAPTVGAQRQSPQTISAIVPGTLSSVTDLIVLDPAKLGYSFRVLRNAIRVGTAPGSGSVSVTPRRNSGGTTLSRGDASVAAGATGSALRSLGQLLPGPGLIFDKASTDTFNLDLNAATGGTLAQVDVVIERLSSVPIPTAW